MGGGYRPLLASGAVVVALLVAVGWTTAAQPTSFAVAAIVSVDDPVDGWLGGDPHIDGDVALAQSVLTVGTAVFTVAGKLRFEATGPSRNDAEDDLTGVIGAYEDVRRALRAGLDERLEMVPELASFVRRRTASIDHEVALMEARLSRSRDGTAPAIRAERASALAVADDYRDRAAQLLTLPSSTLAPAWESTPVDGRLARLDELLSTAFWFAAGESA
jgi:hypothetical protein